MNDYLSRGWKLGFPSAANKTSKVGYVNITNDVDNKKVSKEEYANVYSKIGYHLGVHISQDIRHRHSRKTRENLSGRITIHKENVNKMIYSSELESYLQNGWNLGGKRGVKRTFTKLDKIGRMTKGKIHITNGVINKMIYEKDLSKYLQEGFYRGRTLNRVRQRKKN